MVNVDFTLRLANRQQSAPLLLFSFLFLLVLIYRHLPNFWFSIWRTDLHAAASSRRKRAHAARARLRRGAPDGATVSRTAIARHTDRPLSASHIDFLRCHFLEVDVVQHTVGQ